MKLPAVLAVDDSKENEVTLTIGMSPELVAFSGHFPDNPILPGVVQIDWVMRFAAVHFGIKKIAAPDFQVKFRNVIRPGEPIALTLKLDHSKRQLSFTYQSGHALMSSGQLKLETTL